jgi:hypothetical protein
LIKPSYCGVVTFTSITRCWQINIPDAVTTTPTGAGAIGQAGEPAIVPPMGQPH